MARINDTRGTVDWCLSVPFFLLRILMMTQPQFMAQMEAANSIITTAAMIRSVFILSQ